MKFTATLAGTLAAIAALPALATAPMGDTGGRKLATTLSGAAEVPGPGDSDGTGTFTARVNPGIGQLCYTLTVSNIDPAAAAHIHFGAAGVAGPVVVSLSAPADGSSETCTTIDSALAKKLIQSPADYYVNVHNAAYPSGAIRGQLAK